MRRNDARGFTLLELTISLAISAVIVMIVFAALRLSWKSMDKAEIAAGESQKVRILNDRLAWLIGGTYPFFIKQAEVQKIYFSGERDRIGFVTTSVDSYGRGPEDTAGLKWVSIFVDYEGLKIREKVYFLEDVFDDSGGKTFLLDPDVKSIDFEYFDVEEESKVGEWVGWWDPADKNYFPAAVKFRLTMELKGRTIRLPEVVAAVNIKKVVK